MRNGIVAVETALMLPVWVALTSLALLIGYGTTIHGSCQNAADLASYAIYHGKSDADAVADATAVGLGEITVTIEGEQVTAERSIQIFGKTVPISASSGIVRP